MSEYWVSKKKYWCQYCKIYIADDVPSKSQHENGLRHKGNKDRFIRSLYKAGIKKKNEDEEEKREMKRVEGAAQVAYARDVQAGLASSSSTTASLAAPAPKPRIPPPKPSNPYTDYTTVPSLGISDPDVDRLIGEANVRKSEGRAGDWVTVVPPPPPLPQAGEPVGEVRKRVEGPVDEDDMRQFKLLKKTVPVGLGEIYDPGVIRVKLRVQVEQEATARGPVHGGDVAQPNIRAETHDIAVDEL